jgi:hypothetical protein
MKTILATLLISITIFLCIGTAGASNITISDNRVDSSSNTWYNRGNNPGEDQEVEPGMVTGQVWDLEGFFLNGNKLTMVGGYNFKDGVNYGGHNYGSGDIFIDTNGNAQYGTNANSSVKFNGYDYVLDLDFSNNTYDVYKLGSNTILKDVFSYNSPYSSFWRYDSNGDAVNGYQDVPFTYIAGLTDAQTGFLGDAGSPSHYSMTVDLGFLPAGTTFTSHFTMECGNDNLMGHGKTSVPEPATMLLFGSGLVGLAGFGRRKFLKK